MNGVVDGFLIGIGSASGEGGGVILVIALTIEMTFLGVAFAAALIQQSFVRRSLTLLAPPLCLFVGGALGAAISSALAGGGGEIFLISFGSAQCRHTHDTRTCLWIGLN